MLADFEKSRLWCVNKVFLLSKYEIFRSVRCAPFKSKLPVCTISRFGYYDIMTVGYYDSFSAVFF